MELTDTQLLTPEEGQAAQYILACAAPRFEDDVAESVQVLIETIKTLRRERRPAEFIEPPPDTVRDPHA